MRILTIFILLLNISGCASISQDSSWNNNIGPSSELLVYREVGGHSKAMDVYFGSEQNYVVSLGENEYTLLNVPAGHNVFRFKGQGSAAAKIEMELDPEKRYCLKLKADPAQWAAVAIPILLAAISAFEGEQSECSGLDILNGYKKV